MSSMSINLNRPLRLFLLILVLNGLTSCASYQQFKYITEEYEIPKKVFVSSFTQTWQAVLQVMKTYDLAVQNQEAGVIKTRWIDNTLALNFADAFGSSEMVKAARFKLIVNVVKGFKGGREVAKVSVFKRQLVEKDFLQGWKVLPTDSIQEKTILYRIERELVIDRKLKKLEEMKNKDIEATI